MLGAMEERLSRMTLGSLQNTRLGEVESSSHERVSTATVFSKTETLEFYGFMPVPTSLQIFSPIFL